MPVIIKGSAFQVGKEAKASDASFDVFFQWMQQTDPDKPWPLHLPHDTTSDMRRQLYSGSNGSHWFGVFISARTAEFQHFVKRDGDRIIVEARSVDHDPPVEMNFFCMRKDSKKGIFSHYRGSYSFGSFMRDIWNCYNFYVREREERRLTSMGPSDVEQDIRQEYLLNSKERCTPLFTPGTFDQLLQRLTRIEEVRLTTYGADGPDDQPVSGRIRNVHKIYRLDPSQVIDSGVRQWAKSLRDKAARILKSGKVSYSGSIVGNGDGDATICVNFENSMDDYLSYDYDELD
jgi:hypothetical protein